MRWLAIVNPRARRLRRPRARQRWLRQIDRLVQDIEPTQAPGHATAIARKAQANDGIAVVGGDGTIFEVIAGMDRTRQRLALLPAGGGNSLARDLGVTSLRAGLSALEHGYGKRIDLMQVRLEPTLQHSGAYAAASTVALGYVADVAARAANMAGIGVAAYAIAGMITAPRAAPLRLKLGEQGVAEHDLTGLVVNNTQHLANFRAFPAAAIDDGRLDVAGQSAAWSRQMLHNIAMLLGLGSYDPVHRWQMARLTVELEQPATLVLDGELFESVSAVQVSCLPGALTCQVPTR